MTYKQIVQKCIDGFIGHKDGWYNNYEIFLEQGIAPPGSDPKGTGKINGMRADRFDTGVPGCTIVMPVIKLRDTATGKTQVFFPQQKDIHSDRWHVKRSIP